MSSLNYLCNNTKIISTIGPSTHDYQTIERMANNGMSIARLNFSHGTHIEHLQTIKNIKKVRSARKEYIAIGIDTKGPEIRVVLQNDITISQGDILKLVSREEYIREDICAIHAENSDIICIGVDIEDFGMFNKEDVLFIDDGKLKLVVLDNNGGSLRAVAHCKHLLKTGKKLTTDKKVNCCKWLSDDDIRDIKFGLENEVDVIFLSFVEETDDVKLVRSLCGASSVQLIAKIETACGLEMVEQIASVCDGVMIARGDLGTNIGLDKMFSAQAKILELTKKYTVIMATEMMISMVECETPTRAEISDVGNAVVNGCHAVMLSSETSIGQHPVLCVRMVRSVLSDAEGYIRAKEKLNYTDILKHLELEGVLDKTTHKVVNGVVHIFTDDICCMRMLTFLKGVRIFNKDFNLYL